MNTKRRKRLRLGIPALLALAVASGCTILVGCDSFFYYPKSTVYSVPADYSLDVEELTFSAPGGPKLHGWWAHANGEARGTVVYCHGNHGNLTGHVRFVEWLPKRGYNLLIFDYRGFGKSEGSPERTGTVADAMAAIDIALARDPGRTFVFGHSLGGAVGLVAAAQRPAVQAVIVESTFPSYRAAAAETLSWLSFLTPLLISKGQDPIDFLDRIPPRPLLVIHGTVDHITPLVLGKQLFEAAAEPKQMRVVEGGGHASPWVTEGKAFADGVIEFLEAAIEPEPAALGLEAVAVQAMSVAKTPAQIFRSGCAICHGPDGEGSDKLQTPSIAGLPKWYVLEQLDRFRTDRRGAHEKDAPGRQMAVVAKALDATDLEPLAELIRKKPPFATQPTLTGDLENGRLVYGEQCMECHRYNGQGEQLFRSSPLTSFQDWYLAREFEEFRTGWRGQDATDKHGEKMRTVVEYLDAKSRRDVIAYLATLAKDYPPGK